MKIEWLSHGKKATQPPNPAYPLGIDVVVNKGPGDTCKVALPYPAPAIGMHVVECPTCGSRAVITAAGRPDDPRSVTMPCRSEGAPSITCPRCQRVSYHPEDIAQRFCGACGFHDDLAR